jgi:hypothetical protein
VRYGDGAGDPGDRHLCRPAPFETAGLRAGRAEERRLILAVAYAAVALGLAAAVPLWTLLIGPLILGVPHVIADIRYLILDRPGGLRDGQVRAILLPLAVVVALSAAVSPLSSAMLLVPGLAAIAGSIAFARAPATARLAALLLLGLAAVPLCTHPGLGLLILVHAHNAVAVGLWLALSGREPRKRLAGAAAILGGGVAIALGAFDVVPAATGGWATPADGFDAAGVGATLALPGLGASRSLMLFAYGQAVHYAVWLHLVPGERSTIEPRVSLRSALGAPAVAVALLLILAVPLAGAVVPVETRTLYLKLAGFHAWLELAVAAHLALSWTRAPSQAPLALKPAG